MRSHDIEGGYDGEPREVKPPHLSADESPAPATEQSAERTAVESKAEDNAKTGGER